MVGWFGVLCDYLLLLVGFDVSLKCLRWVIKVMCFFDKFFMLFVFVLFIFSVCWNVVLFYCFYGEFCVFFL